MSALVDTTVLIDHLRGNTAATRILAEHRSAGRLHASEITRLEVLAEMRGAEEPDTRAAFAIFDWHPVGELIAERAGEFGRAWLPSHRGIDDADLAVAATAAVLDLPLLTLNVRHFPMFPGLTRPY